MGIYTLYNPYQCSHYDKAFKHIFNLLSHMRMHTGERHYRCSQCNKDFFNINICDVLSCMMIYMGKKYISSAHVKKLLKTLVLLMSYEYIHREKMYQCCQCYQAFQKKKLYGYAQSVETI